ncbi:MAG TPA: NAD(P)/FAD-dependent oxidoreductase [Solirubrobacteraceae bacterium]|nr:NAD(P)/FAD-dependent oxidoreductase [Solirubrobacteraceae bacterium]
MGAPARESYDVIVIGAGLGGLSAAACLAKAGRSVLVIERQDGPGGNAHAFRRGAYTIDPAIHVTGQGFGRPFLDFYLAALGVGEEVELLRAEDAFGVDIDGERFTLPCGVEAIKSYLAEQFPREADGVTRFIETCAETTRQSQAPPPRVGIGELDVLRTQLPMLFAFRRSTLADVLDAHVQDPLAKAVCGAQWPYLGLPPGRLSFMAFSSAMMAIVDPGPLYVHGSFQSLADALARCVEDHGGEIVLSSTATAIELTGERVSGVELDGGEHTAAPVVVSNADARETFGRLLPPEAVPARLTRRLAKMRPSVSAFVLFSAAKLDPAAAGLSHEHLVYESGDYERIFDGVLAGSLGGTWLSVPTMHDPSLAPEGEHLVTFSSLMAYDIGEPWTEAKPRYTELMIEAVERALPGYRDAITFVDSATPETFQRYTWANQGAAYGWENTPDQTLPKRLDNSTPIEGLFLAGHWTHPGSGSLRCLFSGAQAAAAAQGRADPIEFLASLTGGGA